MTAERKPITENPLVKGGLYFVGLLVVVGIAGVSINIINNALALAK